MIAAKEEVVSRTRIQCLMFLVGILVIGLGLGDAAFGQSSSAGDNCYGWGVRNGHSPVAHECGFACAECMLWSTGTVLHPQMGLLTGKICACVDGNHVRIDIQGIGVYCDVMSAWDQSGRIRSVGCPPDTCPLQETCTEEFGGASGVFVCECR